jgi:acyl carrier protein
LTNAHAGTDVTTEIRAYIVERFLFGQQSDRLTNSSSFMDMHLVDSTGILEVVMFLESRYGIKVTDEEMIPEHLDSIDRIAAFVRRKQA